MHEHFRELQRDALPSNCTHCNGVGAEPPGCPESGPCERCGGWTEHKRLVAGEASALRSQLAEVTRERDEAIAQRDARLDVTPEDARMFVAFTDHFDANDDDIHADAALRIGDALRAHASQPQCSSCHGTRTVMDADHDSRVLTADDCPACSQPKGDGGSK